MVDSMAALAAASTPEEAARFMAAPAVVSTVAVAVASTAEVASMVEAVPMAVGIGKIIFRHA